MDVDASDGAGGFRHVPVLRERVVELFAALPPGWIVDATLGGGGHAEALLDAGGPEPGRHVLGIDRDPAALAAAAARLAAYGERFAFERGRFDDLIRLVGARRPVVGVLFDLGVSSPQLDRAERGFSYRQDAPLDMRMDPDQALSAADVVDHYTERDLARVLAEFGDERYARRIAAAIVAARPVRTTAHLAEIVRSAIPAPARRHGGHPARRTFQAVRIEVNAELQVLPVALHAALDLVQPGGRIVAISYHSGEDRLVKAAFRQAATGGCTCPPALPCGCGARPVARLLRAGGWTPSADEIAANPRAESARLRAVEMLPGRDT